ncbi:MAG: ABC transporter permease [Clostridiales Family XIII bacterium]|jgi:putative ABC transport system permease protein|nr:ABC transporter permease [Clostridiales Family XIII bacterium]
MSTFGIARNNLLHRPFRLLCLLALVAVTAFVIAGGTLLGTGLRNGVESTAARLGADLMILPRGADRDLEGVLLEGKPSTFYLPGDSVRSLSDLEGVKRASPQFYISTFDSAHCGSLVQIIGYDPETDFVIEPWLTETVSDGPKRGEIVIGDAIQLDVGEEMLLFGTRYGVAGKLEKTGMGFDVTVFAGRDTARMLIDEYEQYIGAIPMPDEDAASLVVVEVEEGIDPEAFAKEIRRNHRGVDVVLPQAIIGNLAKHLDLTIGILTVLLAVLWFLSAFVLVIVFTITLNERKREFGVLRALGATRKKLASVLMAESVLLCAFGAGAGVLLFCVTALPFNAFLESKLESEYLLPPAGAAALILCVCFLLCAAGGPMAAAVSAVRIGRAETSFIMREDV